MIKWIFFDLGSTLLNEELAYREYMEECVKMLGSLGMDISVSVYSGKMEEFVWEDLDPIRATWNHFAPTEPRPLWTNEGVSLYPETIDALEKVSQNYRLGIIVNQSSSIRELLKEWGIESYFQLIILSEEVGLSKPDTTIFTLALQKVNIPADRVVYVGDRYDNDILPAKSLGMWTVRILTDFGKHASENEKLKSDWVIPSLQEITNMFEQTKN
ncbi:HAD family hydrolase [Streptococcus suis]|uniref:HAD family hydrolase n=2 Tax=Streptococcus TaxID=1301 RepID=UPI00211D4CAB|nr:HAD family hydrolase [Streptococcus suis]UUM58535.1 HAD family hydrolase [Streptococcus suis]